MKSSIAFCECGCYFKIFELGLTCKLSVDGTYSCMHCNTQFRRLNGEPFTGDDTLEVLPNQQQETIMKSKIHILFVAVNVADWTHHANIPIANTIDKLRANGSFVFSIGDKEMDYVANFNEFAFFSHTVLKQKAAADGFKWIIVHGLPENEEQRIRHPVLGDLRKFLYDNLPYLNNVYIAEANLSPGAEKQRVLYEAIQKHNQQPEETTMNKSQIAQLLAQARSILSTAKDVPCIHNPEVVLRDLEMIQQNPEVFSGQEYHQMSEFVGAVINAMKRHVEHNPNGASKQFLEDIDGVIKQLRNFNNQQPQPEGIAMNSFQITQLLMQVQSLLTVPAGAQRSDKTAVLSMLKGLKVSEDVKLDAHAWKIIDAVIENLNPEAVNQTDPKALINELEIIINVLRTQFAQEQANFNKPEQPEGNPVNIKDLANNVDHIANHFGAATRDTTNDDIMVGQLRAIESQLREMERAPARVNLPIKTTNIVLFGIGCDELGNMIGDNNFVDMSIEVIARGGKIFTIEDDAQATSDVLKNIADLHENLRNGNPQSNYLVISNRELPGPVTLPHHQAMNEVYVELGQIAGAGLATKITVTNPAAAELDTVVPELLRDIAPHGHFPAPPAHNPTFGNTVDQVMRTLNTMAGDFNISLSTITHNLDDIAKMLSQQKAESKAPAAEPSSFFERMMRTTPSYTSHMPQSSQPFGKYLDPQGVQRAFTGPAFGAPQPNMDRGYANAVPSRESRFGYGPAVLPPLSSVQLMQIAYFRGTIVLHLQSAEQATELDQFSNLFHTTFPNATFSLVVHPLPHVSNVHQALEAVFQQALQEHRKADLFHVIVDGQEGYPIPANQLIHLLQDVLSSKGSSFITLPLKKLPSMNPQALAMEFGYKLAQHMGIVSPFPGSAP
jgi:ribosomal protein S15P/S13E